MLTIFHEQRFTLFPPKSILDYRLQIIENIVGVNVVKLQLCLKIIQTLRQGLANI